MSECDITAEVRAPGALTAYVGNTKKHADEDIAAIARSIRNFGFNDPIAITPEGVVIEGHGRLAAALAEGMSEVPVIVLANMSERDQDLYRIAHNKIALCGTFDYGMLVDVFKELRATDGTLTMEDMGFTAETGRGIIEAFDPDHGGERLNTRPQHALLYEVIWDSPEQKRRFANFMQILQSNYGGISQGAALQRFMIDQQLTGAVAPLGAELVNEEHTHVTE